MNTHTSLKFLVVAACIAALSGCKNDDVKTESLAEPAPTTTTATKAAVADCSSHESQIVLLSGQLADSETKAAALKVRIGQLEQQLASSPKGTTVVKASKTVVCSACPEQEACPQVSAAVPAAQAQVVDTRSAAECIALDRKVEAYHRIFTGEIVDLEVQTYINEHTITELEKVVGKRKK